MSTVLAAFWFTWSLWLTFKAVENADGQRVGHTLSAILTASTAYYLL